MKPGAIVEAVLGTRKGQRGRILGEARSTYRGVPDLEVLFEDGMVRWMGPDSLRVIVPAATESDDDVMAPLRRVTG